MNLLILVLALAAPGSDSYQLDELAPLMLYGVDGNSEFCVITYLEMVSRPMKRVFAFDSKTGRGSFIEDGRMSGSAVPSVAVFRDKILLTMAPLFGEPRIFVFDIKHQFQDALRLDEFSGWEDSYSIVRVDRYKDQSLLISADMLSFEKEGTGELAILQVFPFEKRISLLNVIKKDKADGRQCWVPVQNKFFEIDHITGKVSAVNPKTFQATPIFKALPPQLNEETVKRFKAMGQKIPAGQTSMMYRQHCSFVFSQGPTLSLRHSQPSAKKGNYVDQSLVLDSQGKILSTGNLLLLWPFPQKSVMYDFNSKTFSLSKLP